jgi:hypothetical protein
LVALRAMAAESPPYFANQARVRIADIEAAQRREEERRAQGAAVARYRAEGRIEVDAAIIYGAPRQVPSPSTAEATLGFVLPEHSRL